MHNTNVTRVGIFGLGKSNEGVVSYLRSGGKIHLTLRSDRQVPNTVLADRVLLGTDACRDIDEQVLYLSPTVRRDRAELCEASMRGVKLSSDVELFFEQVNGDVFGVTGSHGKSTVSALISKILQKSIHASPPLANFGQSASEAIGKYDSYVAELSSFQLNYFSPHCKRAVITNITPNHLDWHRSFDEYCEAKLNLLRGSDELVFDADCAFLRERICRPAFCAVSSNLDCGALKKAVLAENYLTESGGIIYRNGRAVADIRAAKHRESHTVKNYMLALGATLDVAGERDAEDVFISFSGLSHRCQTIALSDGVRFIDSSIDTSPERTIQTLRSLDERCSVIICGKNKGLSLDELARELPLLSAGAVLCGEIGRALATLLDGTGYRFSEAADFNEAIPIARDMLGAAGGAVLLSPAGTSFDKFRNYEERASAFKDAVSAYISK